MRLMSEQNKMKQYFLTNWNVVETLEKLDRCTTAKKIIVRDIQSNRRQMNAWPHNVTGFQNDSLIGGIIIDDESRCSTSIRSIVRSRIKADAF